MNSNDVIELTNLLFQISPVFTQFLDSTWQIMSQRIDAFEFNERFLLTLHDHVMSCQFGLVINKLFFLFIFH